jgi:hypothetical protein
VFPVRCELDFISQKTAIFIVTAVKSSNLTYLNLIVTQLDKVSSDYMVFSG